MTHEGMSSPDTHPRGDSDSLPFYPILDPYELSNRLEDYRDQLPTETQAQLGDDDYVIHIVTPEVHTPQLAPSALREIIRLANASSLDDVGQHGGPLASLSSQENAGVESLRKFEILHGRDALRISLDLHDRFPDLLESTLIDLLRDQGTSNEMYDPENPFRQEEIGKIKLLNRQADDPVGKKFSDKLGWGWPFYGSVDATPTLISATVKHTLAHKPDFLSTTYIDKSGATRTVAEGLEQSTQWLLKKLQENPEGLVEFHNPVESGGIAAQAWKDSAFAYVHKDGSRANHDRGIASVEVQALAYDALCDSADLHTQLGNTRQAAFLPNQADQLRKQIIDIFWIDDDSDHPEGYFALGSDRDESGRLRTLNVRTSNMGHLLRSRLLEKDDEATRYMRDTTIKHLFSPEMLHSSGIRTLASDEVGFRAGGYHTGSVWLWDTAHIASGLERHGHHRLAWNLRQRIWKTVDETNAFPEFVRGDIDNQLRTSPSEVYVWNNTYRVLHLFEQPPQEIQGWTVSAILAAKYAYPNYLKNQGLLPVHSLEQELLAII